ncbi:MULTISPECIES: hypothetical protein [Streptomyces]|uniref:Uncharacterized protein n=1 Tax=Streptomyces alfalfae TaxID=1642299 RepID=A0A7T4PNL4_9ACTN|nr:MULTISPECIES: hypothetical protein [Streptomyces]QQC93373.1 hypothetical protein I8755_37395 [Streptomyces alfalfae]THC47026.1 hypothetical protein E7X58_29790 [Streptomyces sp. A1499]
MKTKPLLWALLAVAVPVNVSSSFLFGGMRETLVSVASGLLTLASAAALYLTRVGRSRQKS